MSTQRVASEDQVLFCDYQPRTLAFDVATTSKKQFSEAAVVYHRSHYHKAFVIDRPRPYHRLDNAVPCWPPI